MTEKERKVQDGLKYLLECLIQGGELDARDMAIEMRLNQENEVQTFEEARMVTNNAGIVIEAYGKRFTLTINERGY